MLDIIEITDDIKFFDTDVPKASNVLSIQIGSLEYALDFGIDLRQFLDESFQIKNEAFKAYLIQRLAENSINIQSLVDVVENLYSTYIFNLPNIQNSQLVR